MLKIITVIAVAFTTPVFAQSGPAMSGAELTELVGDGATIKLGVEGMGYAGSLTLSADGTGLGEAKTDDGTVIRLAGTWAIKGDQFCRVWADLNDGKEVCETWHKTSDTAAEVWVDGNMVGVNGW